MVDRGTPFQHNAGEIGRFFIINKENPVVPLNT